MMHQAWCSTEVPYCFSRSSIKFQGHTGWKIDYLNPISVRLLGRWQLTNPLDLPSCCMKTILFWFPFHLDTNALPSLSKMLLSFIAPCFVISRWTWSKVIQKFLLWLWQLRFWRVWQGVRQRPWPLILRGTPSQKMTSIHLAAVAVTVMMVSAGLRVCTHVLPCVYERDRQREREKKCIVLLWTSTA